MRRRQSIIPCHARAVTHVGGGTLSADALGTTGQQYHFAVQLARHVLPLFSSNRMRSLQSAPSASSRLARQLRFRSHRSSQTIPVTLRDLHPMPMWTNH
jgi:hypothetical protein